MSKHPVERPRHLAEIERLDEQARVADLPAAAAAHPTLKLLLSRPSLPGGLLLQGAERSKVSLSLGDLLHGPRAEGADQLVFQIGDAHVETQPFHLGAREVDAEAGSLETTPEVALLSRVAETRQPDVEPTGAEQLEESSYGLRTPDRHDGDALSVEVPATAFSERFEGVLVTDPLDEHYCSRARRVHVCIFPALAQPPWLDER